jgi:hypothetical protein
MFFRLARRRRDRKARIRRPTDRAAKMIMSTYRLSFSIHEKLVYYIV